MNQSAKILQRLVGTSGFLAAITMSVADVPPEVWVVGEGSKSVRIIATTFPESVVPTPIELSGGFPPPAPLPVPAPHGIAFSTLPPGAPLLVFVSQGKYLRVISATTRSVLRTIDISNAFPVNRTLTRIGRMEPARPTRLDQPGGGSAWRTFLHAAATVTGPGGVTEAWFVVLDQAALSCTSPPCPNPVVSRGQLPVPASVHSEALDVTVMNDANGKERQRVWVTARDLAQPRVRAFQVVGQNGGTHGTWSVDTTKTRVSAYPNLTQAPPRVPAMMSYEGEAPIWGSSCPAGATGALGDGCLSGLGSDGCFELNAEVQAGDVGRAGFESGTLFAATSLSLTPLAAGGTLYKIHTGTGAFATYPVGEGPSDVVLLDPVRGGKVFVTNRDSDTVTVVRPNGTLNTLSLAAGAGAASPTAACSTCPIATATQETGCSILFQSMQVRDEDHQGDDEDVVLTWTPSIGCASNQQYIVQCQCQGTGNQCPPDCTPTQGVALANLDLPCFGVLDTDENPDTRGWGELGPAAVSGNTYVHYDVASYAGRLTYSIQPDGI